MIQAIQTQLVAGEHLGDAGCAAEQIDHARDVGMVRDEDVRKLMVDQGPGPAGRQVQVLAVGLAPHFQKSGRAEHAIGKGDMIDRHDRVFAGHDPQRLLGPIGRVAAIDQASQNVVQRGQRLLGGRAVGPRLLGRVIQVGQINVEETGLPVLGRQHRRVRAIQSLDWMPANGPQKCFSGK